MVSIDRASRALSLLGSFILFSSLYPLTGAATPVAAQSITDPRSLLLTPAEAGQQAVMMLDQDGADDRGQWVHRRWERERDSTDVKTGPIVVDQMLWLARDLPAARALFSEQVALNEKFPEAADKRVGSFPFNITRIGDEASALSACDDCAAQSEFSLHHRIVIRKATAVSVVYLFGLESVTTQDLAVWFVSKAVGHIPDTLASSAPEPPPTAGTTDPNAATGASAAPVPEPAPAPASINASGAGMVDARPKDLAVRIDEAGKRAEIKEEKDGSDAGGPWYFVRYERPQDFGSFHAGPVTVFSRVFVAPDLAVAQRIFTEQAALNEKFPEAKEKVGDRFELKDITGLGDEARGLSACTGGCNSSKEVYVHKRLVTRVDNVVSVSYLWGLSDEEGTSDWHARYFATLVVSRAHG